MKVLPINAIPNQQLSVLLDGNQWDINLKLTNGGISCSLSRNNEVIAQNARVVAGMRILQAKYQEAGNFAMICNDQTVPDYTQFGVTQLRRAWLTAGDVVNTAKTAEEFLGLLRARP